MSVARRPARRAGRAARHRRQRVQGGLGPEAARRPERDLPGDPPPAKTRRRTGDQEILNQSAVVQYALEPLAVELRDIAVTEVGDNDGRLRVGAVAGCGSHVHQAYNTHSWPVNLPVVLRHEFAG